jgi:hypothetical protein
MLVWYDFARHYATLPPRDASLMNLSRENHPLPDEPDFSLSTSRRVHSHRNNVLLLRS